MKKIMEINGMHCPKCSARAENALNSIEGVSAKVDLKKKCAVISMKEEVSDDKLMAAVAALGFEVGAIVKKKGLFD